MISALICLGIVVAFVALLCLFAVLGTPDIDVRLDCPRDRDPWEAR